MASELDLAARLPGEADILASVAANPTDETAKLVYADWLDDHDDPRGPVLRAFVNHLRDGSPLPSDFGKDLPHGWRQIVGIPLLMQIKELGLMEHRHAIFARAKPAVAVFTERVGWDDVPTGGSKFGGLPDLPVGAEWPRCEAAPLEFLGQLDLAEVARTVAGRALPPDGLLSLFMYHNFPDDEFGGPHGRGEPDGLQIIYTPPGAKLRAVNPPDDLDDDFGRPRALCRLSFCDALDVPDRDSSWPEFDESIRPTIFNYPNADHKLFGYSHVSDLAEDPTPGPEWEQLFQFKSDSKLEWGWGDGHRLFWYIRRADLRARRFGDTVAIDG